MNNRSVEIINRWFCSDVWDEIVNDANAGDQDSMNLMEQCSWQLASLVFHLKNQSGQDRVEYDLSFFIELCDDFEVA